ncbi:MAG TPA: hypothetical protein VGC93_09185 [Thermoanaerobaculia bacterium]
MRRLALGFLLLLLVPGLALAAGGGLRFGRNTTVDFSATSGEPFVYVGPDDEIYVTVPFGLSTTVSLLWKSIDGGRSFIPLGTPILRDAVTGPGGGDTHLDFDHAGRLYYADLSGGCVMVAVSLDRGNTFPPDRTNHLSCIGAEDRTGATDDRQWVGAFGDGIGYVTMRNLIVSVGGNFHLFKTRDAGRTWDGGRILGTVTQSGPLQVDKQKRNVLVGTQEREAILLYQVFYTGSPGTSLRLFRVTDFDDGSPLQVANLPIVTPGGTVGNVFPQLTIDRQGNLYVVWASGSAVFLVTSQDRGETWSPKVQVNPPELAGTNIMPWAVAGDAGRVSVVWYRSPLAGNPIDPASRWDIWMAQSLDALGPAPTFEIVRVNETTIHTGEICTIGLNCDLTVPPGARDRSFLEFPSIDLDSRGAAVVTYNDNTNQSGGEGISGGAYVMVARQVGGASLYADVGSVEGPPGSVTIASPAAGELIELPHAARGTHTLPPASFDLDESGDARFPDHGPVVGASIPALDLLRVAVADDAEALSVTMTVGDLTPGALATAAAEAGGDGVLYLTQWDFADRVYWVAAEVRAGQPVFSTGTLSVIRSATSKKYITYNPDPVDSLEVEGEIAGTAPGTITLRLPRALAGGPAAGASLYSVTAYALSQRGPLLPVGSEDVPNPSSMPIQVDASGPFTYVVGGGERLDGVVEASLDDATFASPRPAAAALDGTWELPLAAGELAAGGHTLYARQRIAGREPSPSASVAFVVDGPPDVTCLDDDDPRIAYGNGWHLVQDAGASGGHFRYHSGNSPQAGMSLAFDVPAERTGILVYHFATSAKGGSADVYVNGAFRQSVSYAGATGSNKQPVFGSALRFEELAPGAHSFELRNLSGGVFVDGFCLESAVSGAAPAAGPGETNASTQTAGGGKALTQSLTLPEGTLALAVAAEASLPVPLELALVDSAGTVLGTARGAAGSVVLERPVTAPGVYLVRTLNLALGPVEVWTLATPLVRRESAPPP